MFQLHSKLTISCLGADGSYGGETDIGGERREVGGRSVGGGRNIGGGGGGLMDDGKDKSPSPLLGSWHLCPGEVIARSLHRVSNKRKASG